MHCLYKAAGLSPVLALAVGKPSVYMTHIENHTLHSVIILNAALYKCSNRYYLYTKYVMENCRIDYSSSPSNTFNFLQSLVYIDSKKKDGTFLAATAKCLHFVFLLSIVKVLECYVLTNKRD